MRHPCICCQERKARNEESKCFNCMIDCTEGVECRRKQFYGDFVRERQLGLNGERKSIFHL